MIVWMLVTKPCGTMPGGSPQLTREQVSIRYRAEREGGTGQGGRGSDRDHRSSWHLPYLLPPAQSPASKRRERERENRRKTKRRGK